MIRKTLLRRFPQAAARDATVTSQQDARCVCVCVTFHADLGGRRCLRGAEGEEKGGETLITEEENEEEMGVET
ncbi:hypothetical protein E2C01_085695 [Portunus trituberculatus]|uniref:Uncharacterized protein n=1 Tax=Portunus trituberculatus TaxID=210409 RepID=A0A5B7JCM5_PORTR|nr:hypothetical protein [Portunus trituberculatus]